MSLMLAEPAPRKPPDTMTATSYDLHGIGVLACAPDGKNLRSDRDAVELIAEAIQHEVGLILIPVERFADDFFRLNTRIAGEIIQKFVTYRFLKAGVMEHGLVSPVDEGTPQGGPLSPLL